MSTPVYDRGCIWIGVGTVAVDRINATDGVIYNVIRLPYSQGIRFNDTSNLRTRSMAQRQQLLPLHRRRFPRRLLQHLELQIWIQRN